MGQQAVQMFLNEYAPEIELIESSYAFPSIKSSNEYNSVANAQMAKNLAMSIGGQNLIIVLLADDRLDAKKLQKQFKGRPRMLTADEVLTITGHPIQALCPFGMETSLPIFCDNKLKLVKDLWMPAGNSHTRFRIQPETLILLTQAKWADLSLS
jgi:prolyl-tRNA editing enzyme YbaK/EbsC (Cys-tRNA(Pro) deacylase)